MMGFVSLEPDRVTDRPPEDETRSDVLSFRISIDISTSTNITPFNYPHHFKSLDMHILTTHITSSAFPLLSHANEGIWLLPSSIDGTVCAPFDPFLPFNGTTPPCNYEAFGKIIWKSRRYVETGLLWHRMEKKKKKEMPQTARNKKIGVTTSKYCVPKKTPFYPIRLRNLSYRIVSLYCHRDCIPLVKLSTTKAV